jgi:hypothetical protein
MGASCEQDYAHSQGCNGNANVQATSLERPTGLEKLTSTFDCESQACE